MKRNQLVFFGIIGIALLIIGVGVVLQGSGNSDTSNNETSNTQATTVTNTDTPPLNIQVAVNRLLIDWAQDAADAFNDTNPTVNGRLLTIQITEQDGLEVWAESPSAWSAQNHPVAWIPLAQYEADFANETNLAFETYIPSIGKTPIIWGADESRANVIIRSYDQLDAQTIQTATASGRWDSIGGSSRWGFVTLAFARPSSSSIGNAVLLALTGNYFEAADLSNADMNDDQLIDWLMPLVDAVPNFSTLGIDPAQVMATRGVSAGEIGFLPESQWLQHYTDFDDPIVLSYPEQSVVFDFPYVVWAGDADEQQAAQAFADYLMQADAQQALGEQGIRANELDNMTAFTIFSEAEAAIEITIDAIEPPSRSTVLALYRWFANYRTAP